MRIEIRGDNVNVGEPARQIVERKVRLALGRIGAAIRSVRMVIRDLNGPKAGIDQSCSIQVQLNRGEEIHVSADDPSRHGAIDRALDRAARATTRLIARRRTFSRRTLNIVDAGY